MCGSIPNMAFFWSSSTSAIYRSFTCGDKDAKLLHVTMLWLLQWMSRSSSKKSFLSPFVAKSEVTLFKQLLTPPPAAMCVHSAGSFIFTKVCVQRSFVLVISANGTQIFHSLKSLVLEEQLAMLPETQSHTLGIFTWRVRKGAMEWNCVTLNSSSQSHSTPKGSSLSNCFHSASHRPVSLLPGLSTL